VESKWGLVTHSLQEADVLCLVGGGDVCCANMTVLVVAIGEIISLGEPPHAHPTLLVIPLGPVLGVLAR
jgi:hypothetical protein